MRSLEVSCAWPVLGEELHFTSLQLTRSFKVMAVLKASYFLGTSQDPGVKMRKIGRVVLEWWGGYMLLRELLVF